MPFGALLLGLYDDHELHFIGHAGTGFNANIYKEVAARLKVVESNRCPFDKVPEANEKATWVKPQLVARVQFAAWTQEGRLRHPVFAGLREDKKAEECRKDTELAAAEPLGGNPDVVRAPVIVGKVLSTRAQVEAELFKGRAENVTLEIDGKRFRVTHLNKVYFPEPGYTKRNLIAYYYRMADYILPFLKDRPLVLRRYPDGIKGQAFFQKNMNESLGLPDWFQTVPVDSESKGRQLQYAIANDRASLLYLTGLGCIDHNPWSSRYPDLAHPDYLFFDLDPSEGTEFSVVVRIAKALLNQLSELKLIVFLKTSGATGIHLYLPVKPIYTYEQLRTFAEIVARMVSAAHPSLVTNERAVAKRRAGTVLIDVHQNAEGRPLAAPYAVRASPLASVSTPLKPSELRRTLQPEKMNIKILPERLQEDGDPWGDFWDKSQQLDDAVESLSSNIEPGA